MQAVMDTESVERAAKKGMGEQDFARRREGAQGEVDGGERMDPRLREDDKKAGLLSRAGRQLLGAIHAQEQLLETEQMRCAELARRLEEEGRALVVALEEKEQERNRRAGMEEVLRKEEMARAAAEREREEARAVLIDALLSAGVAELDERKASGLCLGDLVLRLEQCWRASRQSVVSLGESVVLHRRDEARLLKEIAEQVELREAEERERDAQAGYVRAQLEKQGAVITAYQAQEVKLRELLGIGVEADLLYEVFNYKNQDQLLRGVFSVDAEASLFDAAMAIRGRENELREVLGLSDEADIIAAVRAQVQRAGEARVVLGLNPDADLLAGIKQVQGAKSLLERKCAAAERRCESLRIDVDNWKAACAGQTQLREDAEGRGAWAQVAAWVCFAAALALGATLASVLGG